MPDLKSGHEAFCQAYAAAANGAAAARAAGYARDSARQQASALLRREDVAARLAELHAEQAAERARAGAALAEKLEPVYRSALDAGDHDTVMQAVELQARITGLVQGGATVRPRARAPAAPSRLTYEAALAQLDADPSDGGQ